MKKIISQLGLPNDSTEDTVVAAIASLKGELETVSKQLAKVNATTASPKDAPQPNKVTAKKADFLPRATDFFKQRKGEVCYVTSDGSVFDDKNKHTAEAHAKKGHTLFTFKRSE